ncbi:MAG: squalene--hopene cyclase [Alphaproteobacteria bacterium]|jgi:squalene-hopene/tetraprenyl-beta-curcumene cyclase|nr:squalene--hopene cyclase [Alphaproteobacteria bacterium]
MLTMKAADHEGDLSLDDLIEEARARLAAWQRPDGHWVFELEADATIPSEYVLLQHFLGEPRVDLEPKIGCYLRARQGAHGGWPLFHGGDLDISATVKAYYALKLIGDDPDAPHMRRAREALLARGGAACSNVFTRFSLALFGQVPWRAVPVMPIEIMLLPRWFPFHLSKVSYWSRTVIVPLLVLSTLKPRAANPRGVDIQELFLTPPEEERSFNNNPTGSTLGELFLWIDRLLQIVEPHLPMAPRRFAIDKAMAWATKRLNGEDGLGAIYPAMANLVMAFRTLGYPDDHPDMVTARGAIEKLVTDRGEEAYCQPCFSPVWDTGLAAHALMEAGMPAGSPTIDRAMGWLSDRQVLDTVGDWGERTPGLRPGGWPFQYGNDHYPDIDDTAMVVMALHRADPEKHREAIARALEWVIGLQSEDGGWGAFDADNTCRYLNHIPFADHGALLDPPTADVTARCVGMLAQLGYRRDDPVVARAIDFLRREQEPDGSWFGRWGTNYVYGTWSVLSALNAAGEDMNAPYIRQAVDWLKSRQRADGGWGEDGASYWPEHRDACRTSTPSQTAWALLGLMAAGEVDGDAVREGVRYLHAAPRDGARWHEDVFTAVGFPRVFYLKYHGYAAYFPLWALARYRRLMARNDRTVEWGL